MYPLPLRSHTLFRLKGIRLPFAWAVLMIAFAAIAFAWYAVRISQSQAEAMEFDLTAERALGDISKALESNREILRRSAASFSINSVITSKAWHAHVNRLKSAETLNDVQGFEFAKAIACSEKTACIVAIRTEGFPGYDRHPGSGTDLLIPAVYLESFTSPPALEAGFDMSSDPLMQRALNQRALNRARDTGNIALGEKFILPKATADKAQTGFLMILPLYQGEPLPTTIEERRRKLTGFISIPFIAENLLRAKLNNQVHNFAIQITDGHLFNPIQENNQDKENRSSIIAHSFLNRSALSKATVTTIEGQPWTISLTTKPVTMASGAVKTNLMACAGFAISLLLFWLTQHARHRASQLVKAMTMNKRDLEAQLTSVMNLANEAIVMIDPMQKIALFNPAAEKIFQCPATEAINSPLSRFLPNRFKGAKPLDMANLKAAGISGYRMEASSMHVALRANGEEFPFVASISGLKVNGKKFYTLMLCDLTQSTPTDPVQKARQTQLVHSEEIANSGSIHDPTDPQCAQMELERSHRDLQKMIAMLDSMREEEQKRLAQEMHDDLGQLLAAMKMDLSSLQQSLPKNDVKLGRQVSTLNELVDAMVTSVRRIIADLPPQMLEDISLFGAIELLLANFEKRHAIEFTLDVPPFEPMLDNAVATPIYRIVQEALNNVAKHARATRVDVKMDCHENYLVLRISDDGIGISRDKLRKPGSFGLIGMRERTAALGGEMTINDSPGGTIIQIVIPNAQS